MDYFKQGSFYYGKRKDGKYTCIASFDGLSTPNLSVVSENVAKHNDYPNEFKEEQISKREFKHKFLESVALIAGFHPCYDAEIKSDELNESDVQKGI